MYEFDFYGNDMPAIQWAISIGNAFARCKSDDVFQSISITFIEGRVLAPRLYAIKRHFKKNQF